MPAAFPHPRRNPRPHPSNQTSLIGSANSSTNPRVKSQAPPLPPRKPNPPRLRSFTRSLHRNLQPSQPRNRLTARRSPTSTRNQPALSIPLSNPKPRTAFPPQPASPLTLSWTGSTPSGCPSPQMDASLGGGAKPIKRSNFIEFYKISR